MENIAPIADDVLASLSRALLPKSGQGEGPGDGRPGGESDDEKRMSELARRLMGAHRSYISGIRQN